MKITDNRKSTPAWMVCVGQVFELDGEYYMGTDDIIDDDGEVLANAVSLKTGMYTLIASDKCVTKIDNVELIIT